jgi:hypothetical protein
VSRAERRRKARELRRMPQRNEFAPESDEGARSLPVENEFSLVPDTRAGLLPVDKYRAHFVNVPAHFSERYHLVRFAFPNLSGEALFPEKAPASWVREVSDPLELGAVWFFTMSDGMLTCAEYRAECSHLAVADDDWRDAYKRLMSGACGCLSSDAVVWELESFGS